MDYKTVSFGIEDTYPPFSWTEADGSFKGFHVDLANELCRELQVKCKIISHGWSGIFDSLFVREYDAILAAMSITEERKEKVDFTKYARISSTFIANKNSGFNLDNSDGMRVGVKRATTHEKYLDDNYGDRFEIVRYDVLNEAFLDLANGLIASVFSDLPMLEESVIKQQVVIVTSLLGRR